MTERSSLDGIMTEVSRELLAIKAVSKMVDDLAQEALGTNEVNGKLGNAKAKDDHSKANDEANLVLDTDFIKLGVHGFLPAIPPHLKPFTGFFRIDGCMLPMQHDIADAEGTIHTIEISNAQVETNKGSSFWMATNDRWDPEVFIKCELLEEIPEANKIEPRFQIRYPPVQVLVRVQKIIVASQFPKYFKKVSNWREWIPDGLLANGAWNFFLRHRDRGDQSKRCKSRFLRHGDKYLEFKFVKIYDDDCHNTTPTRSPFVENPTTLAFDRESLNQNWHCYRVLDKISCCFQAGLAAVPPDDAALLGLENLSENSSPNRTGWRLGGSIRRIRQANRDTRPHVNVGSVFEI